MVGQWDTRTYVGGETGLVESTRLAPVVGGVISTETCDITVTMDSDGSFTETLTNCSGEIFSGPRTGDFWVDLIVLQGQIVDGGGPRILLFADVNNNVETVTFEIFEEPFLPQSIERICARSGTAGEVDDYGDDDDDKHRHWDKHKHWDKYKHRGKDKHKHRHRDDD